MAVDGEKLDNKKKDVAGSLAALACGMDGKSDAAKLRGVIDSIELALSSGVSRKKVLETISESLGINMSIKTFEKNLYRIRKKIKQNKSYPQTNEPVLVMPTAITTKELVQYNHDPTNNINSMVNTPLISSLSPETDDERENDEGQPTMSVLEFFNYTKKPIDIDTLLDQQMEHKRKQKEEKERNKTQK